MTTYHPPPAETTPPKTEVKDPYPNKAIAAGVAALTTVLAQWVATGDLQFTQEGITAIGGLIGTGLVWLISNWKRKGR